MNAAASKPIKDGKQRPVVDINVGLSERPPWFCRYILYAIHFLASTIVTSDIQITEKMLFEMLYYVLKIYKRET